MVLVCRDDLLSFLMLTISNRTCSPVSWTLYDKVHDAGEQYPWFTLPCLDEFAIFFNGNPIQQNLLPLINIYMMYSGFILLVNFVIVFNGNYIQQNFGRFSHRL